jgi:hypothetical protein
LERKELIQPLSFFSLIADEENEACSDDRKRLDKAQPGGRVTCIEIIYVRCDPLQFFPDCFSLNRSLVLMGSGNLKGDLEG